MDYWAPRLIKRSYSWEGKTVEIPEWQIRIAHLGNREWFNCGTANRAAAADKARRIYLALISNGWQATLQEFKPDMQVSKDGCTVGKFLEQVKAVSGLKPVTYEIYAKKFRSLVAGVFNIHGGKAKHDYVNGGHKEWLDKVQAIRLDKLTPEKVNDWKVSELKAASKNPLKLKRASVTARSILLSSKALFTPEIRKHLTIRLPSPLPFEGVALPEAGKSRLRLSRQASGNSRSAQNCASRQRDRVLVSRPGDDFSQGLVDGWQPDGSLYRGRVLEGQMIHSLRKGHSSL